MIIVVLNSCGLHNNHKQSIDDWTAQEAKNYDIPILIDARPEKVPQRFEDASCLMIYNAHTAMDESIAFYQQEMERYGWNLLTSFINHETLLIFEKPSKNCCISIRSNKDQIKIVIFLKSKE